MTIGTCKFRQCVLCWRLYFTHESMMKRNVRVSIYTGKLSLPVWQNNTCARNQGKPSLPETAQYFCWIYGQFTGLLLLVNEPWPGIFCTACYFRGGLRLASVLSILLGVVCSFAISLFRFYYESTRSVVAWYSKSRVEEYIKIPL